VNSEAGKFEKQNGILAIYAHIAKIAESNSMNFRRMTKGNQL